jgi:outer membrane lipoprotein SlyB
MFKLSIVAIAILSLSISGLSGCATMPTGPSVSILPAQGKPFDAFQTEDIQCRKWAEMHSVDAANAGQQDAATSTLAGTALGAAAGAAIGSASGDAGAGAVIGVAAGLIGGAFHGIQAANVQRAVAQKQYDDSYIQCMYAHGNQVPTPVAVVQPAPRPVYVNVQRPVVIMEAPAPVPVMMEAPAPVAAVPEALFLTTAPMFAYAPAYGMYVALGVPYDLLYNGHTYYYTVNGLWYSSPFYSGPWTFMAASMYPPVFRTFHLGHFHEFREREFHLYEHDRAHYAGRVHRPEFRNHEVIRREHNVMQARKAAALKKPAVAKSVPGKKTPVVAKAAPVKKKEDEKK